MAGDFLTIIWSARTLHPSCCYFFSTRTQSVKSLIRCVERASLADGRSSSTFWSFKSTPSCQFPISHLAFLLVPSFLFSIVQWFDLILFRFFQIKQKRGRPPKHLPKEHDGDAMNRDKTTEHAYRESSPDDFDEGRNKFKRGRASEGTSSVAHKPSDQTLIGKLNTLCYFSYCSNI